ncbi:MAG: hypothetical protein KBG28_08665 [Kofleriaceae bacterium]|nr:hypothetical protein [Kofleriaceae bacterium]
MTRTFALITVVATLLVAACAGSKAPTTTPTPAGEGEERKAAPEEAPGGGAGPHDEMPPDGTQADPCDGGEVAPN